MQSPKKIELYLMCMARKTMCITLPIILQSFLFITQEEGSWRKTISKTPRARE
jgi:hypothetical protein